MNPWTNWSPSAPTCGAQTQTRTRSVQIPAANGGIPCPNNVAESRDYVFNDGTNHTMPCPKNISEAEDIWVEKADPFIVNGVEIYNVNKDPNTEKEYDPDVNTTIVGMPDSPLPSWNYGDGEWIINCNQKLIVPAQNTITFNDKYGKLNNSGTLETKGTISGKLVNEGKIILNESPTISGDFENKDCGLVHVNSPTDFNVDNKGSIIVYSNALSSNITDTSANDGSILKLQDVDNSTGDKELDSCDFVSRLVNSQKDLTHSVNKRVKKMCTDLLKRV